MKVLDASFVGSAADARAVPRDALPQIALVGRSNVGKSTLINALTGRRIARTSATPGKTRLVNIYRVHLSGGAAARRLYLVDLPGYGYAKGPTGIRDELARITEAYFRGQAPKAGGRPEGRGEWPGVSAHEPSAALLVIDARHPALDADVAAREWLERIGLPFAIVAAKMDKLPRSARPGALGAIRQQHDRPALPVSAKAGEGLDELWKEIVTLVRQ